MADEVPAITFESLYDMVRKEKANDPIQALDSTIYLQIINYLKTKTESYKTAKEKNTFNENELEKMKTQIVSARKLIKELYERRERKILQLAVNKSRIKEIDDSSLLENEKKLLSEISLILDRHRENILLNLVNARIPSQAPESGAAKKHPDPAHEDKKVPENMAPESEEETEGEIVRIKFLQDVPRFLGTEMETLGPYSKGDTADLQKILADILVGKGAAQISETSGQ